MNKDKIVGEFLENIIEQGAMAIKEMNKEETMQNIHLIQIIPVTFMSKADTKQTNLYGLDDKGRIWMRSYCHWNRWVLSEAIFIQDKLKSQRKEIVEKIEKIRSNTIGCGDVLDDLKNLITKEDITDLILKK